MHRLHGSDNQIGWPWPAAVALFVLLFTVYLLTMSGGLHIVDEVSLFAVTESVARRGAFDTNAIAWTQWVNSPGEVLGAFGPGGDVFSKKGPALPFLAVPLYWLVWVLPGVGLIQGTLLFNMLVTAATALLLWRTALALGYAQQTGAAAALLFGLGTIAWPYATHFFGEPLSALALLALFYSIVLRRSPDRRPRCCRSGDRQGTENHALFYTLLRFRQTGRLRYGWAAGLAAGLLIATHVAHAVLLPFFLLYLWHACKKRQEGNEWTGQRGFLAGLQTGQERMPSLRRCLVAPLPHCLIASSPRYLIASCLLPLAAVAVLLAGYNWVRFGHPLWTGYHFETGEGFNSPLWQGLWGLLLSPYRGLFWYTPLAIASLLSWPRFITRHKEEGWLLAAMSGALVLLFSCWWMWWAGFAWGPRFLVPLMPFLVVVLMPMLEKAGDRGNVGGCSRGQGLALSLLIVVSVTVQLLAVSVNYVNYEIELRGIYPTDWADPLRYGPPALYNPWHSPVLGQVRLLWRDFRAYEDLAWVQAGVVQWDVVGAGLALLGLAGVVLGLALGREARSKRQEARSKRHLVLCFLLVIAVLAFTGFALTRYAADPVAAGWSGDQPGTEGYVAILEEITAQAGPDEAIVTVAPYHYHIPMNRYRGRLPIYGYAQEGLPLHVETERVLRRLLAQHERIWFVTAGLQPADEHNGIEAWLAEQAFQADDRWFGDFRLLCYGTAVELTALPATARFGPAIEMAGAAVTPGPLGAGSILAVELHWRARETVEADLVLFLQLLDAEGRLQAQRDGRPQGGYAPVTTWPPGQVIVDRQGLLLPSELPPGEYTLIAGWYDATSLERLPVWSRDGELLSDHLVLDRVTVSTPANFQVQRSWPVS